MTRSPTTSLLRPKNTTIPPRNQGGPCFASPMGKALEELLRMKNNNLFPHASTSATRRLAFHEGRASAPGVSYVFEKNLKGEYNTDGDMDLNPAFAKVANVGESTSV